MLLLQQCFLISVSSFFRDPTEFGELEKALRQLVARKQPGDAIRVWVPACATGEEAYSVAILLGELLGERLGSCDVRVFATDVDQEALEVARAGVYGAEELAHLDAARRQRWFTPEGSRFRIDKAIRELCIFSVHDVIGHPPFIRMDLISCRNLLIYVKPEQQADLIGTFHYALNADGLLLLGRSESTGFNSPLFEVLDANHKLYRRRSVAVTHPARFARFGLPPAVSRPPLRAPASRRSANPWWGDPAGDGAPIRSPAVLVSASFEPLHFFGRAQRYFALPGDEADFSVFSLCLPELRNELKALCYRMVQEGVDCLAGVSVSLRLDEGLERIRPVLRRVVLAEENGDTAYLICFEPEPAAALPARSDVPEPEARADELVRLRQELADTREHLQLVIEELEASNEELQSLNEELQSSGEELQSSNEELQSSNEELTTLNDELRAKSLEASQLSATLGNIQNSIRTSLCGGGPGRPHHPLQRPGHAHLRPGGGRRGPVAVRRALPPGSARIARPGGARGGQRRVAGGTGAQRDFHYLMQIDPYRNELNEYAGAVLTFADIPICTGRNRPSFPARRASVWSGRQAWKACWWRMARASSCSSIRRWRPCLATTRVN